MLNPKESWNHAQRFDHDARRNRFLQDVATAATILRQADPTEIPDALKFVYTLMRELCSTHRSMSLEQRQVAASYLAQRSNEIRPNEPPVDRYEFLLYRYSNIVERAAPMLQISARELAIRLEGSRRNPKAPEVVAFVIWAFLAYAHGLIDHLSVDAIRDEYPWIPEYERPS